MLSQSSTWRHHKPVTVTFNNLTLSTRVREKYPKSKTTSDGVMTRILYIFHNSCANFRNQTQAAFYELFDYFDCPLLVPPIILKNLIFFLSISLSLTFNKHTSHTHSFFSLPHRRTTMLGIRLFIWRLGHPEYSLACCSS
jgi:hypothetical protein